MIMSWSEHTFKLLIIDVKNDAKKKKKKKVTIYHNSTTGSKSFVAYNASTIDWRKKRIQL